MITTSGNLLHSALAAATLILSISSSTADVLRWDGSNTLNGQADGGAGTWDANTTANWWDGASDVVWPNTGTDNDAVFGNIAGTVSISNVTANDLTFETTGYVLSGAATLTLNGTTPTITTISGVTATIGNNTATEIAGSAGFTKLGAGTLVLNGSVIHTFTGGLNINGGTLTLDNSNLVTPTNLVNNTNALSLSGGTLSVRGKATGTSAQTFNGTVFNSGTSTILVNRNAGTSTTLTLGTVTRGEAGAVGVFNLGASGMTTAVSTVEKIMVSNPTGRWLGSWAFNVDPTLGTSRWIYVDASGQLRVNNGTAATSAMGNLTSDTTVYTASADFTLGADQIAMGVQSTSNATYTLGTRVLTTEGLLSITASTTMAINGSGGIRVGAGNQLVTAGAGNLTISSPILNKSGDTSHVTHAGGGVLLLTGTSSYTGQTTVNSGKITIGTGGNINTTSGIRVNGGSFVQTNGSTAVTPTVTLMAGGVDGTATINTVNVTNNATNFVTNGNGGTGALTIGNLTFGGAGSINIRSAGSAGLTVTNTLTTTPANGKVTINVVAAPTWVNGNTYNLLGYGSWAGAITDFVKGTITGLGARQSAALGTTGSSNGFLTLAISGEKVLWTGAASAEWKTVAVGSPFNWKTQTGLADTEFIAADDVIFDDTGANTTVDISAANVSPNSILFNNSTKDYTISSTGGFGISSGVLTKNGSGTVTLNTPVANTGVATINGGTLKLNNGNALANAGLVSLANTAGVTLNVAVSETIGAVSGGGSTGGEVTIDAGQTLTLSSGAHTFSGNVSGAGSLNVAGAFQTLSGELSVGGDVTVSAGRLFLPNANNSYTGATTIAPGAGLVISANNALGGTANGTTVTGAGLSAGGVLGLSGGINYTALEKISGSGIANTVASFGPFTAVQRGFIQSVSGNNSFSGNIEINATGLTRIGVQNGAQLTLNGAITMANGVTGVSILFRAGDNDGDFVTLANSGNSWDSDAQLFSFNPGTGAGVKLGANNALPTAYSILGNAGTGNGTMLDLAGYNQTLNGLSNSTGTLRIANSSSTLSTLTLNTLTDKDAGFAVIQDGSGSGKVALVKTGAFSQTLQGANTYTGGTFIKEGRLNLTAGDDRLAPAGTVVLGDTSTTGKLVLGTAAVARSQNLAGLTTTGLGGSVVGGHPTNNSTLILSIASGTNTFAGNLGGTGTNEDNLTLIKNGVGKLELTNANTYTGNTIVNTGTLLANNTSGSATGAGTITVNGTAVFGGTGAVSGVVTTTTNSILSPGASIESLTIGGVIGNGTLLIEYDMASIDLLSVTNTLDITTMKLNFSGTSITPAPAYIFATYGSLSGTTFASVANVPAGFNVDYAFGGNNIALVAVPEPGTMTMLAGLFFCRLIRRRR